MYVDKSRSGDKQKVFSAKLDLAVHDKNYSGSIRFVAKAITELRCIALVCLRCDPAKKIIGSLPE